MASYVLGRFVLDLTAGDLRRGEEKIAVPPKVFDLLVYLVKNRGRLVSHDELLDVLWPAAAVGAASLTRAVANLRRALDDPAEDPLYVETVPRRGYRLIAAVKEMRSDQAGSAPFALLHQGRPYVLQTGENVLGRADESVVPIHSPAVSRHHARLTITSTAATLEDLGSKNGTYVRGARIAGPVAVGDGDEIRVGPIKLVFRAWPRDATTITAESLSSDDLPSE